MSTKIYTENQQQNVAAAENATVLTVGGDSINNYDGMSADDVSRLLLINGDNMRQSYSETIGAVVGITERLSASVDTAVDAVQGAQEAYASDMQTIYRTANNATEPVSIKDLMPWFFGGAVILGGLYWARGRG